MNALSVRLPWAYLLVAVYNGQPLKDVENRAWYTEYRGGVYIHASQTIDDAEGRTAAFRLLVRQVGAEAAVDIQREYRQLLPKMQGVIIGEQNIIDCRYREKENEKGQFSLWHIPGNHGFYMNSPKLYERFIPYKGKLKFFPVDLKRWG
jgi:hypothetical protein